MLFLYKKVFSTNQEQAGVDETERARAADARWAVYNGGSHAQLQGTASPHRLEEPQEHRWTLRHTKVRPRCVVEVQDLSAAPTLHLS